MLHYGVFPLETVMPWSVLDLTSVIALGVLGAFLALFPLKTTKTKVSVFVAVGALTIVSAAAKMIQDEALREQLTGGDNYCFVTVAPTGDGQFHAQITNEMGRVPDVNFAIYRLEGDVPKPHWGWSGHRPCLKTTANLGTLMPLGRYRVDFLGSNFTWHQYLTIRKENGKVIKTFRIEDDNGNILSPEKTKRIAGQQK